MTYNIRLDLASDEADRWSARRDQFIGQVAFVQPDILGLNSSPPQSYAMSRWAAEPAALFTDRLRSRFAAATSRLSFS